MVESFFEKLLADIPGGWVFDRMFFVATCCYLQLDFDRLCLKFGTMASLVYKISHSSLQTWRLPKYLLLFFKENKKVFIGPQPSGSQSQRTGEHPSSPHVEDSCANPQHDTANFKNDSLEKKQESHTSSKLYGNTSSIRVHFPLPC